MNNSVATEPSTSQEEHVISPAVLHELDLGRYLLLIRANKSLELIDLCTDAISGVYQIFALDSEEAYHLYISLKEVFK